MSPPGFSEPATALSNDGENDTSEHCHCRRYCRCPVVELESLENESGEGTVSKFEGSREIEDSSAIDVDLEEGSNCEG